MGSSIRLAGGWPRSPVASVWRQHWGEGQHLAALVAGCNREELMGVLRFGWRYVVFVEVLLLAVLAAAVFLRSFSLEVARTGMTNPTLMTVAAAAPHNSRQIAFVVAPRSIA